MAKIFSAEQIKLNGVMLTEGSQETPSDANSLYFNHVKLAAGANAADITTTVDAGSGLYGSQDLGAGVGQEWFYIDTLDGNSDQRFMTLGRDIEMHISGRNGISVDDDSVFIDADAILNSHILNDNIVLAAGAALSANWDYLGTSSNSMGLGGDENGSPYKIDLNIDNKDSSVTATMKIISDGGSNDDSLTLNDGGVRMAHLWGVDWALGVPTDDDVSNVGGDAVAVSGHLTAAGAVGAIGPYLSINNNALFDGSEDNDINVTNQVCRNEAAASTQTIGGLKIWSNHQQVGAAGAGNQANLTIHGNLVVEGDSTTIQVASNEVNIGDRVIVLNSDLGTSASAQDAGVEVRIGALEDSNQLGGPARIHFGATPNTGRSVATKMWEAGHTKYDSNGEDNPNFKMYPIHTQEHARVFASGLDTFADDLDFDFGVALGDAEGSWVFRSIPNVVASLSYVGPTTVNGAAFEPEMLGHIVTDVTKSGCKVNLTYGVPNEHYVVNLHASIL